ncbi:MAG: RNA polymerase sigma factor [bacterium]|nr:RNA polymerase sigma factor [bacterium]
MTSTNLDIDWLLSQNEWVQRLARRLVGDGPDADDLVQETWTRALGNERRGERSRGWLATIARNIVRERFRAGERRRAREELAAGPESDGARPIERAQLRRDLLDLVLSLPEPERTAVVLRTIEGLSYEDVARKQRISVVAARKRTSRAIERLREKIDASPGGREAWAVALAPFLDQGRALATLVGSTAGGAAGKYLVPGLLLLGFGVLAVVAFAPAWFARTEAPAALAGDNDGADIAGVANGALDEPVIAGASERTLVEPESALEPESRDYGVLKVHTVALETGQSIPDVVFVSFQPTQVPASEDFHVRRAGGQWRLADPGGDRRLDAWRVHVEVSTDERARATFHVEAGVAFEATVFAGDYDFWHTLVVDPIPAGAVREIDVAVRTVPDLEIVGRVLDADSREPVREARIRVEPTLVSLDEKGDPSGLPVIDWRTDVAGRFEGKTGSWRKLLWRIDAPGYATTFFPVPRAHEGAIEIELHAAGTLRGTLPGAEKAADYQVRVVGRKRSVQFGVGVMSHNVDREVPVGTDGAWEITSLPPHVDLSISWLRLGCFRHRLLRIERNPSAHLALHTI